MQKDLSIQQLENLNLESFKDHPLDLIKVGKDLISSKRNDKAIEVYEFGLKTVIEINNNNEFHIDCAKFNYYYADVLIANLFESNDIFNPENLPVEEERKETRENSDTKSDVNNNLNSPAKDEKIIQEVEVKNNGMMEESDDEEEAIDEEDDSDEKVRNCFILDCFRTFGNGGKDIKDIFRKIRYCFVS